MLGSRDSEEGCVMMGRRWADDAMLCELDDERERAVRMEVKRMAM